MLGRVQNRDRLQVVLWDGIDRTLLSGFTHSLEHRNKKALITGKKPIAGPDWSMKYMGPLNIALGEAMFGTLKVISGIVKLPYMMVTAARYPNAVGNKMKAALMAARISVKQDYRELIKFNNVLWERSQISSEIARNNK